MNKARQEKAARERLRAAEDRACVARGEAQWMNGYRAGRWKSNQDQATDDELYQKEQAAWRQCAKAETAMERATANYARAVRQARPDRDRSTRK